MGKTAEIMKHEEALKMRIAINALISITDPNRYCVAIAERKTAFEEREPDYEVHLFISDKNKSGLIDLTLLAHAIEVMGSHFLAVESTYDAGTKKGEDIRQSVKIW